MLSDIDTCISRNNIISALEICSQECHYLGFLLERITGKDTPIKKDNRIFSRCEEHQLKHRDFIRFLEQKDDIQIEHHTPVCDYKYALIVGNEDTLKRAILSYCLVFYNGYYKLREHIPEESFVYVHLSNFEQDYNLIKKAIEEDWWSKKLPFIKEARKEIYRYKEP